MKHAGDTEIWIVVDGMWVIVDEFAILVGYGFEEYSAKSEVSVVVYHFREWPSVRPFLSCFLFLVLLIYQYFEQY